MRTVQEQLIAFRKSMEADGAAQRAECRRLVSTAVRRAGWLLDEVLQVSVFPTWQVTRAHTGPFEGALPHPRPAQNCCLHALVRYPCIICDGSLRDGHRRDLMRVHCMQLSNTEALSAYVFGSKSNLGSLPVARSFDSEVIGETSGRMQSIVSEHATWLKSNCDRQLASYRQAPKKLFNSNSCRQCSCSDILIAGAASLPDRELNSLLQLQQQ